MFSTKRPKASAPLPTWNQPKRQSIVRVTSLIYNAVRPDDQELSRQGHGASCRWRKSPPVGTVPAPSRKAVTNSRRRHLAERPYGSQLQSTGGPAGEPKGTVFHSDQRPVAYLF